MTQQQPLDPVVAFSELGRIKLSETSLDEVLSHVAELAKRTLPGASEVSITLVRNGQARTAASTGELAVQADEMQYQDGHGPCLAAAATIAAVPVEDMAAETRWPEWAHQAAAAGVGSSLSIGLPVQEQVTGALNLYSKEAGAFDSDATALAQTFAGYAAVALANAHLYETTATLAQQMQAAMESRAVIEQAKGILMGQRRCTADEAFAILSKVSQDSNRKLRDVAQALVDNAQRNR